MNRAEKQAKNSTAEAHGAYFQAWQSQRPQPSKSAQEKSSSRNQQNEAAKVNPNGLLSLIPGSGYLKAGFAAAALLAIGAQTMRLEHAQTTIAELKSAWSADKQQAAEASQKAEQVARATEQKWIAKQKERDDANDLRLQSIRADAAIASAGADSLRKRLATIANRPAASQATSDPAVVESSPSAPDITGVLANVLGQCIGNLREMAAIADASRAAGSACVAQYEGLEAP